MLTIIVILAIWVLLSLPLSVILGHAMKDDSGPLELVGMDGENAVFRRPNGSFERVALSDRTAA